MTDIAASTNVNNIATNAVDNTTANSTASLSVNATASLPVNATASLPVNTTVVSTTGQITSTTIYTTGDAAQSQGKPEADDKVLAKFVNLYFYKCLLAARADFDSETYKDEYPKFQTYEEYTNDTNNENPLVKNIGANMGAFMSAILSMTISEILHKDLVKNNDYLMNITTAATLNEKIQNISIAIENVVYPNTFSEMVEFNNQKIHQSYFDGSKVLTTCADRKGCIKAYVEQGFKTVYDKPYYAELVSITTDVFTNFIKVLAAKHYRNMNYIKPAITMNYIAGVLSANNFNCNVIDDAVAMATPAPKSK